MKRRSVKTKKGKFTSLKTVLFLGAAVAVALVIGVALALVNVPDIEANRAAVGIYDKVGTDDWMEWKPDGTAISFNAEKGGYFYGTWEQVNATVVVANYEHAPPNLTYIVTEDGVMWRDVVYLKRGD